MERIPEAEPRRLYVLSADIEAHGHTGDCPGCAVLASHGKAIKPNNNEHRERFRTIIERTLTGKVRMNAYKDRVAESGMRSRWRIDLPSHLAVKKDNIHIGKRRSETANEEQPDKLRKTIRLEQEAPNTSSSVSLEYPASGEKQDRPEPVLVQSSGHVDDDTSTLEVFHEMDERKSRCIKEVLDW